jgi:hypothetical protein
MQDLYFYTMSAVILSFFGGVGMMIAWSKRRNRLLGFALGFVGGFLGWGVLALLKSHAPPEGQPSTPRM